MLINKLKSPKILIKSRNLMPNKISISDLYLKKKNGEKITVLTGYDFTMASLLDKAGIEVILVGDSAANVMQGHETTLPITLKEIIGYAKSVSRAVEQAFIVVDIPFGYYQGNPKKALNSAVKIIKKTNVQAVKLEGGKNIAETIRQIVDTGIPIMGHLGLTPQSINQFGSYRVRGKNKKEADNLLEDAYLLEKSGCFSIVLEKIPQQLGKLVSENLNIPTIGIGAGPHTDGQVLVTHDMLGINSNFHPKFIKTYANLDYIITEAVKSYIKEVKSNSFPNHTHSY